MLRLIAFVLLAISPVDAGRSEIKKISVTGGGHAIASSTVEVATVQVASAQEVASLKAQVAALMQRVSELEQTNLDHEEVHAQVAVPRTRKHLALAVDSTSSTSSLLSANGTMRDMTMTGPPRRIELPLYDMGTCAPEKLNAIAVVLAKNVYQQPNLQTTIKSTCKKECKNVPANVLADFVSSIMFETARGAYLDKNCKTDVDHYKGGVPDKAPYPTDATACRAGFLGTIASANVGNFDLNDCYNLIDAYDGFEDDNCYNCIDDTQPLACLRKFGRCHWPSAPGQNACKKACP